MLNSFTNAMLLTEEASRSQRDFTVEELSSQAGVSNEVAKNLLASQAILNSAQQPIFVNKDTGVVTTIPPKKTIVESITSVFDLVSKGIQTYSSIQEAVAKPALQTTVKPTVQTSTISISSNPQKAVPNGSNTIVLSDGSDSSKSTQSTQQPIMSGFTFDIGFIVIVGIIALAIFLMNRK